MLDENRIRYYAPADYTKISQLEQSVMNTVSR